MSDFLNKYHNRTKEPSSIKQTLTTISLTHIVYRYLAKVPEYNTELSELTQIHAKNGHLIFLKVMYSLELSGFRCPSLDKQLFYFVYFLNLY